MTAEELKLNVEKALNEIRPFLESDGGNISLVGIEDGKLVRVRLEGACVALQRKSGDFTKWGGNDY